MKTLRFVLSDNVLNSIIEFAKLHKLDHRLVYKEEWKKWLEANNQMVQDEINRMRSIGYNDCVLTKMFDAGRYYFRKKELAKQKKEQIKAQNVQTVQNEQNVQNVQNVQNERIHEDENVEEDDEDNEDENIKKKEKRYVTLDKDILYDIECHIKKNIFNDNYTPSNGYFDFHVKNVRVLNKEKKRLEMEADDFINKIKKTYKNKYFFIKRQLAKLDNANENNNQIRDIMITV